MARGYVYKRCPHGITGTPAKGSREALPACKVSHGAWWWKAEAEPDPLTGKRKQATHGGYASKTAALEGLTEQMAASGKGRATDDKRMTVERWLLSWLEENRQRWEPKTYDGYRCHVDAHLIPLLGPIRLRDLRRHHIEKAFVQLGLPIDTERVRADRGPKPGRGFRSLEQRTPRTLDGIRRTLRSALAAAARRGLLADNPAAGRIDAIGKVGKAAAIWWQPHELQQFLAGVADDPDAALWTVAAYTGLRRGELLGLRWTDTDLSEPSDSTWPGLLVQQTCAGVNGPRDCFVCRGQHLGRQLRGRAKTEASTGRWVPLAEPARQALLARKAAVEAHVKAWPDVYTDHGLVWALGDGAPLRPDGVTKRHAELVAVAGLPPVTLHDMRHGAASLLLAGGMPIELVAMILGHDSVAVTRGVYAHGIRSTLAAGMDAAAGLVQNRRGQSADGSVKSAGQKPDEMVPDLQ